MRRKANKWLQYIKTTLKANKWLQYIKNNELMFDSIKTTTKMKSKMRWDSSKSWKNKI